MSQWKQWGRGLRGAFWGVALLLLLIAPIQAAHAQSAPGATTAERQVGGELRFRTDPNDASAPVLACPLTRTDIEADISGLFGRVRMRQVFTNPSNRKIEALYVFPLPENAAVDQMVMTVGKRRVVGIVKERQEARAVYEAAKAQGKVASLLDQERPNVFTQSVANIAPGARVVIEIGLVQTVAFADGAFTWSFPTVVGPRYVPGAVVGKSRQTARVPDTDRVPDASRVSPPVAPPDMRTGQSLGLTVRLRTGGLALTDILSEQHPVRIDTSRVAQGEAVIRLAVADEIPNRDFVLHYRIGGAQIGNALFTFQPPALALAPGDSRKNSGDKNDRYFSLLLTPPLRVRPTEAVPKEMVFVIDRSGSMEGFPIEKAKETMRKAILAMNPNDTFNLLSFAGGTGKCFARPQPNTERNRAVALKYLSDLYGSGGTEMLPAIEEALGGASEDGRLRVVCFMTDGYIGNEGEIIAAIQKHVGVTRVFAFGIGSSVNRYLLDAMARAGRGAAEYVTLEGQANVAVERFRKRIQSPVLTNVALDFHGLPVYDVYPRQIPDLFDSAPVVVYGRIRGNAASSPSVASVITLRGQTAGGAFRRDVSLNTLARNTMVQTPLPSGDPDDGGGANNAVVSLWARAKVDDLLAGSPLAWQGGQATSDPKIKENVIALGVRYRLMTPYTSFVAVDDKSYTGTDAPDEVSVPVETPAGVSYEGAVGGDGGAAPVFDTKRLYGISGDMATGAAPSGTGAVASAGQASAAPAFVAQPGDPLIRITGAPADTRLIAAVLPDGTTIPLVKSPLGNVWEAHFDIPLSAAEGTYDVKVHLVRTNGVRRTLVLHYGVDTRGAVVSGSVRAEKGGAFYRLEIESREEAARVTVLLPSGERATMTRANPSGSLYRVRVPAAAMRTKAEATGAAEAQAPAKVAVTFIITDRAHNRTVITIDGSR